MTEAIQYEYKRVLLQIGGSLTRGTDTPFSSMALTNLQATTRLINSEEQLGRIDPACGLTEEEAKKLRFQISKISEKIVAWCS